MTAPSQHPKRGRRRLIAAFVLVFVSMCSWWYWPRGDARFVGTWAMSVVGDPPSPFDAVVTFYRNGTFEQHNPYGKTTWSGSWRIVGDEMVTGVPDGLPDELLMFVEGNALAWFGLRLDFHREYKPIDDVGPNSFTLGGRTHFGEGASFQSPKKLIYRRIPE
jgi:hypothetical protein